MDVVFQNRNKVIFYIISLTILMIEPIIFYELCDKFLDRHIVLILVYPFTCRVAVLGKINVIVDYINLVIWCLFFFLRRNIHWFKGSFNLRFRLNEKEKKSYIDYCTNNNPDLYKYLRILEIFNILIPFSIVWQVAINNGGFFYSIAYMIDEML